jgi:hypothetical protein
MQMALTCSLSYEWMLAGVVAQPMNCSEGWAKCRMCG